MSDPVLELRGVTGGYGGRSILNGVDLTVNRGEFVCLIGHNGAGKSTILRAIYGMLPRHGGEIVFETQRVDGWRPHRLLATGIAYVPQGRTTFPRLTVLENIQMGAFLLRDRAEVRDRVSRVMDLFPILRERSREIAASLSGGEQRMLEIARALMTNPRLMLLDEPSIGLAPRMVDRVFDTIESLRREGLTILIVEQSVRKALERADRAGILELGRVKVCRPARELLADANIGKLYFGARSA
jgi:branched-chain amino acid transport system ATP-binding protein